MLTARKRNSTTRQAISTQREVRSGTGTHTHEKKLVITAKERSEYNIYHCTWIIAKGKYYEEVALQEVINVVFLII